jgi:hypothetical protein
MLHVYTARVGSRDPDALDITRKGASAARRSGQHFDGEPFAPSWAILRPALAARREGDDMRRALDVTGETFIERRAWERYVPAFVEEMRASYRAHRPAWAALLARERVVLCCYCADPQHCHRRILAGEILPKLGAVDGGEIPEAQRRRLRGRVSRADLSPGDRAEVEKFERLLCIVAEAGDRPIEALHDAVYGEDEKGPRDFRVKH